jgi:hypothetical protein
LDLLSSRCSRKLQSDDSFFFLGKSLHSVAAMILDGRFVGATVRVGTVAIELAKSVQQFINQRKSLLVLGGVLTGKTTLLNEIARLASASWRVMVIGTKSSSLGNARFMSSHAINRSKCMLEAATLHGQEVIVVESLVRSDSVSSLRLVGASVVGGLDCVSLALARQDPVVGALVSEFDVCVELDSWKIYPTASKNDDFEIWSVPSVNDVWQCYVCETDNSRDSVLCSVCQMNKKDAF